MLCVIPFFSGDKDQAIRLAGWINELGGVQNHDCLLVFDESTTSEGVLLPLQDAFRNVSLYPIDGKYTSKWKDGSGDATAPNEMWINTAWHIYYKLKRRWFWMEPDANPTRSTWLDEIETEDKTAGKPFMGTLVHIPQLGPHMSGIAVYPPNVCDYSIKALQGGPLPWDVAGGADFLKHAHFTNLICHLPRRANDKPSFPDVESLTMLPKEAAVFHPNKDGTLIDRLQEIRRTSLPQGELDSSSARNHGNEYSSTSTVTVTSGGSGVSVALDGSIPAPAVSQTNIQPKVAQVRLGSNGGCVIFEDGTSQILSAGQIVKARGRVAKPKRTAEEQAKIDLRMAALRARKLPVKARHQQAAREHR